ncbi:MAG: hypothetical protein A4E65_03812 [Syntrophorhabdus sp. PtaU1.Bin153]|nr:MAG: hypothetical protein A4E65_03812 [Syntrophorhabdus sp. PtaU1.Bin153]
MLKFRMLVQILEGMAAFALVIYLLIKVLKALKDRNSRRW